MAYKLSKQDDIALQELSAPIRALIYYGLVSMSNTVDLMKEHVTDTDMINFYSNVQNDSKAAQEVLKQSLDNQLSLLEFYAQ